MIPLTHEEVEAFFEYLDNTKLHKEKSLFYKLQYYYARRSDEIVQLKVSDIDLHTNRITFPIAKKRKEASINLALIPKIREHLIRHIEKKQLNDDDYIFIENIEKKDSYKRNVRDYLERNSVKITKELFGKEISLNTHDFRRMSGQHLYIKGKAVEHLQKLYQHVSIDQTIEYLQIDTIVVDQLLDCWEGF